VWGDHDAVGELLSVHELREYERVQLGPSRIARGVVQVQGPHCGPKMRLSVF
jgi:hypothetical protein